MTGSRLSGADTPRLQRADGALILRIAPAAVSVVADPAGGGRIADLYQHDPCRALMPSPDPGEAFTAVLVTTAGGLTGGDRLRLGVTVEAGANALCTPQAAEKIYRAGQDDDAADIGITLAVGAGGALEWLPQETILFDGARLERSVDIDLRQDARLLAGDITVFGRIARGERLTCGRLFDRWQLRQDGRLLWRDAIRLDGENLVAALAHPAGFAGVVAQGLILARLPDPAGARDRLREMLPAAALPAGSLWGATVIEDLLLIRLLDADAARLRRHFGLLWAALRPGLGRPATMPRLWHF
ncbi:urease accessory protein UreD [Ferrovibrio sp.]|uniref:urease accessory protein UreD n=1 Tax=Ferrovibrio sp. TaxID=1917215 RepID=UPI0026089A7E|nr:urease accessory protein UreD [Ferrovibrio sp.]